MTLSVGNRVIYDARYARGGTHVRGKRRPMDEKHGVVIYAVSGFYTVKLDDGAVVIGSDTSMTLE